MRIAITGGTGFVGRHLAARLEEGSDAEPPDRVVVVSRRTGTAVDDVDALTEAFRGCDAIAHCAGINREIGDQTFDRVHVRGTEAVVEAARRAGVRRVVMLSFLRARPGTGSPYHETKWAAEEIVRRSGVDHVILKAGMIYGHGDHLVDHVSHAVQTFPVFATVGMHERTIRPVPVGELVEVMAAALHGQLTDRTVAVVGGEELTLSEAVRRIGARVGRHPLVVRWPLVATRAVARLSEWTMTVPLLAVAQQRMLAEGVSEAAPYADPLPEELAPRGAFDAAHIDAALPPRGPFTLDDLRIVRRLRRGRAARIR